MKDNAIIEARPLFELVDALIASLPFTRETVEEILHVSVVPLDRNDAFVFYDGVSTWKSNDVAVGRVDLRLPLVEGTGEPKGFLVFDVKGTCILEDVVRARYPEHTEEFEPHLKRTQYIVTQHNGVQLSFGIAKVSGCLASIVISPGRAQNEAGKK